MSNFSAVDVDFDEYHDKIIQLMIKMQHGINKCLTISSSLYLKYTNHYYPFPYIENQDNVEKKVVFVIPTDKLYEYKQDYDDVLLDEDRDFIRDVIFGSDLIEYSIGYFYTLWDKNADIFCLYDLCFYDTHYNIGEKKGTNMFTTIINYTDQKIKNQTSLWLGIDIQNVLFYKIIELCTKFGFKNPYISTTDQFGNNLLPFYEFGFVGLSRFNKIPKITPENVRSARNELYYTLVRYLKTKRIKLPKINEITSNLLGSRDSYNGKAGCKSRIYFNVEDMREIRNNLINHDKLIFGKHQFCQKEISGKFVLSDYSFNEKMILVFKANVNREVGYTIGDNHTTPVAPSLYSFHTHPKSCYIDFKVTIGYPSGEDYYFVLKEIIYHNLIFHAVITLEGVYVISLNPWWDSYEKIETLSNIIKNYPGNFHEYVINRMELSKSRPMGYSTQQSIILYCEILNSKKLFDNIPPVFKCSFINWEDLYAEKNLGIYFPSVYDQCLTNEIVTQYISTYNKK